MQESYLKSTCQYANIPFGRNVRKASGMAVSTDQMIKGKGQVLVRPTGRR